MPALPRTRLCPKDYRLQPIQFMDHIYGKYILHAQTLTVFFELSSELMTTTSHYEDFS